MNRFPKTARHPNLLDQADNWRTVRETINVGDDSQLSDLPDLAIAARTVKKTAEFEYSKIVAEIIGANAIRALAKGYESLDALAQCDREGVSVSATVQAYNASFFSARAFCMLMGFGPLDRDSTITVDAFLETSTKKGKVVSFRSIQLHRYKRWGHEEVWALARRLVHTVKVPNELEEVRNWLRTAKLENSSKLRNSFHYDDKRLSPIEHSDYIDFPDRVQLSIFDVGAPRELTHQFLVAKYLAQMCIAVISKAGINHLLWTCASKRRLEVAFVTSGGKAA